MKDEMQEMTWNQKTAAYVAGTTERTLRNWNSLENPPPCIPGRRGKPAVYPAQEFVAWLIEYRLGQITGSADAGDPQQMRARLDRLRGDAGRVGFEGQERRVRTDRHHPRCAGRCGIANQGDSRVTPQKDKKRATRAECALYADYPYRNHQGDECLLRSSSRIRYHQ